MRRTAIDNARPASATQDVLRLLVLVLLHVIYGLVALVDHLVRRPWRAYGLWTSHESPKQLCRDSALWTKRPHHMAIAFSESRIQSWRFFGNRGREYRIREIAQDVHKLVRWSLPLGLQRLSVYDANGLIRNDASLFQRELCSSDLITLSSNLQPVGDAPPSLLVGTKDASGDTAVHVTLLSARDGKAHIGRVTQTLAEAARRGHITSDHITVDFLHEKLSSSLMPEPDLLIALGEPSLRLHGFPPWHIRLSEIYHEPSLSILGPARVSYRTFRRALSAYSACELRRGT